MKKYNYQTCIRMSDNLADSITKICDEHQINESDYIRNSLAESIRNDTQNPSSASERFMFG